MSTIEERTAYLNNPFFTKHLYGDFSPFYVTIAICSIIGISLIILNVICGCCSKYTEYWQDRHTGNRWLVSIWSSTPHKQPPLDFTELKSADELQSFKPHIIEVEVPSVQSSPIQQRPPRPEHSRSLLQKVRQAEERELQKRESDI